MEQTGQDLLAGLTPAQQEAVTHMDGPLLILAAAGSGKRGVITRRVAWLLQQGVRHGNILAITFTNKAAGVMRQRVEELVPGNRVRIRTFHRLGASPPGNTRIVWSLTATSLFTIPTTGTKSSSRRWNRRAPTK